MGTYGRWLGLLALVCAAPAMAAPTPATPANPCELGHQAMSETWQGGFFDVPPRISTMMLDAIKGDTADLTQRLAALPAKSARRWRLLALNYAAFFGRTATVKSLLEHGADASAKALQPAFTHAFYHAVVQQAKNSGRPGGKLIGAMHAAGRTHNGSTLLGPPMYGAVRCREMGAVRLLLRHGAKLMQLPWPKRHNPTQRGNDAFVAAIMSGDADIVRLFFDHGAKPCVEDRRIAANWQREKRKRPVNTIASIGRKQGLPASLVNRLVCHAAPAAR